ncbi:LD-carboxypeptidase [candidate division KSB1 bacterium]|nr:LD-carboxypeptidase [candidate division KSB1 bacterium]
MVAPASPVFEASSAEEGAQALENLGFRVKRGKHLLARWGYLAGSDEQRVEDLHDFFQDPEVKAIVALRGGYGTLRLLPLLDYDLIRRHPKILLGYSDLTSLHLAIHRLAGIVTFHGAVALSTFNDYSKDYLLRTLGRAEPCGPIKNPPHLFPRLIGKIDRPARGALVGGNLTLVCASLGTAHEIDTRGKILFLEEVGEEPYSIDRMLTQLGQAGKLQQAAGILVDRCAKCKPADYKPAFNNTLSVEEILEDRLGHLDSPVLINLSIGHVADKPVLPLGVDAEIDPRTRSFALVENAVET